MDYTATTEDIARTKEDDLTRDDHPSGYLPDRGLVDAVNVALILSKPLLLTGPPGTGKTQLARSLAWQLARRKRLNVATPQVEPFYTKSTSTGRDLFYTFDAIRRFQARGDDNAPFITYNALGKAILGGLTTDRIPAAIKSAVAHREPARCVVLIDEIDKAPRDFPNDLLNEIEKMSFRVPELDNVEVGGIDALPADFRPIVVITSNSEKNLPEPFLRRCIYYDIPFPADRLGDILVSRLAQFTATRGPLINDALTFFTLLRDQKNVKRSPAELIEWLMYMLKRGADPQRRLREAGALASEGLPALVKNPADQATAQAELARVTE